ncbi:MAG: hypothetical protein IJX89_02890 [Alphaproteobacteria bacterium]|nr:hypothetical protein [Alphaproteobacteria bacterium]
MSVKFKDFILAWYRAYHLYNMDDPRKQRWMDLRGKAFEINARGEYVFLDDKRTATQKGWTNPKTGLLATDLPAPDLSDEDWRYFYALCRTAIRSINDRREDLMRNDPDKNPLPIDKWFGDKNLKAFSAQEVSPAIKDKFRSFALLVRNEARLKNKLLDSFSADYSLETFLADLIDQDYSRNSQFTIQKIQSLIRILPGMLSPTYDFKTGENKYPLEDSTRTQIYKIFAPAATVDDADALYGEFDSLSAALDPANEQINPAQLRQFQDPSVYREILKALYAADKPEKKSSFYSQFASAGGDEITNYMSQVITGNNYESGANELIPKLSKQQNTLEKIKEKIDDFTDEHFKRLTDRAARHIYIDVNAQPIVNAIVKEKILPTDGISKILEKKEDIKKRVQSKQPSAKKGCDFLFEALEYIKSSGDMDAALDGAFRNGRKAESIAFEVIKYAISKHKVAEAKTALEVLSVMRYDTFSSAHWTEFHKSQTPIFGDDKLSFNKDSESVSFITRALDKAFYLGVNGMFWLGVMGRNIIQHRRGKMDMNDMSRMESALDKINTDSASFTDLSRAQREYTEIHGRLNTARDGFGYAMLRRAERDDLNNRLTELNARRAVARLDAGADLGAIDDEIARIQDELAQIAALETRHSADFARLDNLDRDITDLENQIEAEKSVLATMATAPDMTVNAQRAKIKNLNLRLGALRVSKKSYQADCDNYLELEREDRVAQELYQRLQSAADRGAARATESKPYNAPKSDIQNMQMLMAFWNAVNGYTRGLDVNSYNIFKNIKDVRKSSNLQKTFNDMFDSGRIV